MKATRLIEILQSIVDDFGPDTPVHLPDGFSYPPVDTARVYRTGGAAYLTYQGDETWNPKHQSEHRVYGNDTVLVTVEQQYQVCGE
jgi:hypothetical protein